MKSHNEIEDVLKNIGSEWPEDNDLLLNRVMSDIADRDSSGPKIVEVGSRRRMSMKLLAIAASVTAMLAIWWEFGTGGTLYADVSRAVRRARTVQAFQYVQKGDGKPVEVSKCWYEKGVGFRYERDQTTRLGNSQHTWTLHKDLGKAVRSSTGDIEKVLAPLFEEVDGIARQLDREFSRHLQSDQEIDGVPCSAYRLTNFERVGDKGLRGQLQNETARIKAFLDPDNRLVRSVFKTKQDNAWVQTFTDWRYDQVLDSKLFEPEFGDNVKIVDADDLFNQMFDPTTAVHSEERDGLVFAIHQISRFGDKGVYFVSSVRGTAKTLEQFPQRRVRVRPGEFVVHGPAKNYSASPMVPGNDGIPGCFRLKLATATHQGVDVCWWAMVPRATAKNKFEFEPGKLKFQVGITPGGEYAKARHMRDGTIYHMNWNVELDVVAQKPIPTLSDIANRIYSDHMTLAPIRSKSLWIGTMGEHQSGSVDTMSTEEFAQATSNRVKSWQAGDD